MFRYVNELGKNYLSSEKIEKESYHTKMLIHNEIGRIVPTRLKSLNSNNYIYYSVHGLIPISQSMSIRKFTNCRIESLLRSFLEVCKNIEDYLLPVDRIVVNLDFIYESYSKENEFLWIYGEGEIKNSFVDFFKNLLDRTDYKEDQAVKNLYCLYQTAKECEELNIGGSDITNNIRERVEEILKRPYNPLDAKNIENISTHHRDYEPQFIEKTEKDTVEIINYSNTESKEIKENKNLSNIIDGLEVKNKILKIWDYLISDIGSKQAYEAQREVMVEEREELPKREIRSIKIDTKDRKTISSETVLLSAGETRDGIYCLRGEDVDGEVLITEFPFFIGKARENISYRIDDSTVSRYHARIDKEENTYYITDLNSTNGTFINGIRLIPYNRTKIGVGDYIIISRKRFEFTYLC